MSLYSWKCPYMMWASCSVCVFAFFCSLLVCLVCLFWCLSLCCAPFLLFLWKPLVGVVAEDPANAPAAHHPAINSPTYTQTNLPDPTGLLNQFLWETPANYELTLVFIALLNPVFPVSPQTTSPEPGPSLPACTADLEPWSLNATSTRWRHKKHLSRQPQLVLCNCQ